MRNVSPRDGGFMAKDEVGYLIGCLAKAPTNRRLATALVRLATP